MEPTPPEPAKPPHDRVTAFHEAGHAVIALALERPVAGVSVLPDREKLGVCKFAKGVHRPTDDWLEREILIGLAGMAAEAQITGNYGLAGAAQDLKHVRKLALQRVGDRQVEKYERRMLSKVENMLSDEGNWLAVEKIAAELIRLGVISGRTAKHLYEQAIAACE